MLLRVCDLPNKWNREFSNVLSLAAAAILVTLFTGSFTVASFGFHPPTARFTAVRIEQQLMNPLMQQCA